MMRTYTCVQLWGSLIPKSTDKVINIEDASTHKFGIEEGCGWSPDGSFIHIKKVDGRQQLIFEELTTLAVITSVDFGGNCPVWVR